MQERVLQLQNWSCAVRRRGVDVIEDDEATIVHLGILDISECVARLFISNPR
jgi:hypothetical protein